MQPRVPMVISGFNPRAVLTVLRCFEAGNVDHLLVARKDGDPVDATTYAAQVDARIGRRLDIAELASIVDQHAGGREVWLVPTTEFLNRWALRHRDELADARIHLPLGPQAGYLSLSDKGAFDDLCRGRGLPMPGLHPSVHDAPLPFAAKPRSELDEAGTQMKPVLVHAASQRAELDDDRWLAQEWVAGPSRYLLFHRSPGGDCVVDRQQNGAQQGGGGSVVWAWRIPQWNADLEADLAGLLAATEHVGLAMFEIKGADGAERLIECNPRPWGPLQLVADHASPVLAPWLELLAGAPVWLPKPRRGAYTWIGGVAAARHAGTGLSWFPSPRPRWRMLADVAGDVHLRRDSWRFGLRELARQKQR